MRAYLDSSALLKRVIREPASDQLHATLRSFVADGSSLVTSSLAWVEVSRALRRATALTSEVQPDVMTDVALSGVLERPIGADVIALARRVAPVVMRSLDAVHLATAILLEADVVVTYDRRLLAAAREHGLTTSSPGT